MLLWIFFAVLTAFILCIIFLPFARKNLNEAPRETFDTAVYKDQLQEIDADYERGLINFQEAKTARTEIARKILNISKIDPSTTTAEEAVADDNRLTSSIPLPVLIVSFFFIPFLGVSLYLFYGSPSLPNQPHHARQSVPLEQLPIASLIAKMEDHLRASPQDGRGWDLIAPIYLKTGRFNNAVLAYSNAIRINGESTERIINYAESLFWARNQQITPDVEQAFEKALELKPDRYVLSARLAQFYEQSGKSQKAINAWKSVVQYAQANPRITTLAQNHISRLQAGADQSQTAQKQLGPVRQNQASQTQAQPGPTAEDVAAASQMSATEQRAMINSMVEGLAARLTDQGGSLEEWIRLVRAYKVMGKDSDAKQALKKAKENLKNNQESLATLDVLAKDLRLKM